MLAELLYNIDLFGFRATLNYNGKEKSKSKFGGLCSLILICFVIWAIFNSSKDLFSKVNPKAVSSQSNNEEPGGVFISPEGFPIAIQVQTSSDLGFKTYINDSIYHVNVYYILRDRVKNGSEVIDLWDYKLLVLERCKPEHFGTALYDVYSKIFELPMQCIASNQPGIDEISLQGVFNSDIYRGIYIELLPCNNETSGGICAPQEEIETTMSGGWLDINYNNIVVNPNDYNNPDGTFQDYFYTMLSPSNYYETYIELGRVEVSTDYGWLLEDTQIKNYTNVVKISTSMLGKAHPRGLLASVYINMGKLQNFYSRRYKKVQDILAEVAGLTNTALLVLLLLTSPYLKAKFQESLINELFDVKIEKESRRSGKDEIFELRDKKETVKNTLKPKKIQKDRKGKRRSKSIDLSSENELKAHEKFKFVQKRNSLVILQKSPVTMKNFPEFSVNEEVGFPPETGKATPKPCVTKTSKLEIFSSVYKIAETPQTCLKPDSSFGPKEDKTASDRPSGIYKSVQPHLKYLKKIEHEEESPNQEELQSFVLDVGAASLNKNEDLEGQNAVITERKSSTGSCVKEQEFAKRRESNSNKLSTNKLNPDGTIKQFEIAAWEFFCSLIYKPKFLKKKIKIMDEGGKEIQKRLDVRYILKEIRKLEKLRALLLDPDQLILFENLPKAQISVDDDDGIASLTNLTFKEILLKQLTITSDKSLSRVDQAYERIKNKNNKTNVDKKLLEAFDQSKI